MTIGTWYRMMLTWSVVISTNCKHTWMWGWGTIFQLCNRLGKDDTNIKVVNSSTSYYCTENSRNVSVKWSSSLLGSHFNKLVLTISVVDINWTYFSCSWIDYRWHRDRQPSRRHRCNWRYVDGWLQVAWGNKTSVLSGYFDHCLIVTHLVNIS